MKDAEMKALKASAINAVHIAVTVLDAAHLHEAHEQLVRGKVDPHLPDRLKRLIILIENTPWPPELQDKASELAEDMRLLVQGLGSGDKSGAKTRAGKVHAEYHHLVKQFYDRLPATSVKSLLKQG